MNVLTLSQGTESKDIKLSDKKVIDTKSEEKESFFENLISEIISDESENKNKNFLLSKLLNLSSEFEKKEESVSEFSDGKLFTDNQIEQVSIQELLQISLSLKEDKDIATFPTDSKSLKEALLKPEVVQEFKSAKNIKELLDIAKKNGIEVKNFQFFKEEAALEPKDQRMVQKIKSEEIFKLIEKQLDTKADKTINILNSKIVDAKPSILQTILTSKEIIKPQDIKVENQKVDIKLDTKTVDETKPNTNVKTLEKIIEPKQEVKPAIVDTKTVQKIVETKPVVDIKPDTKPIVENRQEIKKTVVDTKTVQKIIETKPVVDIKPDAKPIIENRQEIKKTVVDTKTVQKIIETKPVVDIKPDAKPIIENRQEIKQTVVDTKTVQKIIETKPVVDIKPDAKPIVENRQEIKQTVVDTKTVQKIIETKPVVDIKPDAKPSASENRELKQAVQKIETQKEKIEQLQTIQKSKQQTNINNFESIINVQKTKESKEIQITNTIETTDNRESNDKLVINQEVKTQNIEKTKNTNDLNRTFNTFAQDFKEKVESYKAPLMKIKMELKPAGLGEVDVTLISRGNNLQVNINSNTHTIAMFAQNQVEFKNSLINMGFSDLQMNFSDQQKKEQEQQNSKNGKNAFEQFNDNEEQDSFEMIVPRYI